MSEKDVESAIESVATTTERDKKGKFTKGNSHAFQKGNIPKNAFPKGNSYQVWNKKKASDRQITRQVRAELSKTALTDLLDVYREHGKQAYIELAKKYPQHFLGFVHSTMPKETEHVHTVLDDITAMSEDELRRQIAEIEAEMQDRGQLTIIEGTVDDE